MAHCPPPWPNGLWFVSAARLHAGVEHHQAVAARADAPEGANLRHRCGRVPSGHPAGRRRRPVARLLRRHPHRSQRWPTLSHHGQSISVLLNNNNRGYVHFEQKSSFWAWDQDFDWEKEFAHVRTKEMIIWKKTVRGECSWTMVIRSLAMKGNVRKRWLAQWQLAPYQTWSMKL